MANLERLPGPVAENWEWQIHGACRSADPTLFFHPDGERGPQRDARDNAAKAICAPCPVRIECQNFGLNTWQAYGVWGGLSETDRENMHAQRRNQATRLANAEEVSPKKLS